MRYSTTGETILRNVQPLFADLTGGGFAVAHNGNLTNALTLRDELVKQGAIFQSTSDTETILQLVARSKRINTLSRFTDALFQIEGAYALVVMTNKKLIGARDPLGIRPLVIGNWTGPIFSPRNLRAGYYRREICPRSGKWRDCHHPEDGLESVKPFPPMEPRPCIFEYIYFARPDSTVGGKAFMNAAKNLADNWPRKAMCRLMW